MADTKFTPGRWIAAQKHSSKVGLPVVASPHGRSIASVTFFGLGENFKNHDDESYANANLIAAAPELYEAIERLVKAGTDAFNAMSHYAEVNNTTSAVSHNLSNALDYGIFHLAKARGEAV